MHGISAVFERGALGRELAGGLEASSFLSVHLLLALVTILPFSFLRRHTKALSNLKNETAGGLGAQTTD